MKSWVCSEVPLLRCSVYLEITFLWHLKRICFAFLRCSWTRVNTFKNPIYTLIFFYFFLSLLLLSKIRLMGWWRQNSPSSKRAANNITQVNYSQSSNTSWPALLMKKQNKDKMHKYLSKKGEKKQHLSNLLQISQVWKAWGGLKVNLQGLWFFLQQAWLC